MNNYCTQPQAHPDRCGCEPEAPVGYVSGERFHAEHERLRECRKERDAGRAKLAEAREVLEWIAKWGYGDGGRECAEKAAEWLEKHGANKAERDALAAGTGNGDQQAPEGTTITEHHIKVEAPRESLIGKTDVIDGWPVAYVQGKAAIQYHKHTADFTRRSCRPWKVGRTGYAELKNALRALAASTGQEVMK